MLGVVNGVAGGVLGSNETNDVLTGGEEDNVFFVGRGQDSIDGGSGQDVLNVDGEVIEWTFVNIPNGSVVMVHPTWGVNTLTNIESIFFARSGETLTIEEAFAATAGLPRQRVDSDNVLNGGPLTDTLQDTAGLFGLYGGVGDDTFEGIAGNFSQVNYDGLRSEFTITENDDGSITVSHPIWGTDTLNDIDALVFTGAEPGVDGVRSGDFEQVLVSDIVFDTEPTPPTAEPAPTPAPDEEEATDISSLDFTQIGTQGADVLVGTNGADVINGRLGDDNISGGNGNDIIHSGGGNDFLSGDAGNDIFIFAENSDYDTIADFETGHDQIDISNYGFTSFDQLNLVDLGNSVALFINETASVELLGVNNVSDLSADDFIFANTGTTPLTPVTPVDPVTPPTEGEVAPGTGGDDVIIGSDGDDVIRAAQGDDLIDGGAGNDNIRAGAGEDNVAGGTGNDFINGRGGNDFLAGDAGADIFFFEQNSGFDTIADFGNGNDRIDVSEFGITSFDDLNLVDQGSSVAVYLDANTSAELLGVSNVNELSASDFIFADAADDGIIPIDIQVPFAPTTPPADDTVNLVATDGNDVLTGTDGSDTISALQGDDSIDGGAGNDVLNGNRGDDDIAGGNGADVINGGNDNDNIAGGNGADTIIGGNGNDFLVGDAGADTFVFTQGSGFDTIGDFGNGNDRIDLSAFDFDDFGDLNIVEQNNSVFIFIDENTSIELANIDDADNLSADDFIL